MTTSRKVVLALGLLAIAAMCFFPPTRIVKNQSHHYIYSPQEYLNVTDYYRLGTWIVGALAATGAIFFFAPVVIGASHPISKTIAGKVSKANDAHWRFRERQIAKASTPEYRRKEASVYFWLMLIVFVIPGFGFIALMLPSFIETRSWKTLAAFLILLCLGGVWPMFEMRKVARQQP